ncbi:DEAD/DEAH box helicase [Variovorax rhizosphaerae]|uniref:DEAD/DEAH box helicase n=1 Tax=Variovorax rhizosphaerae TaxID=1836200 RepID=A0ABU8WWW4_9BURK
MLSHLGEREGGKRLTSERVHEVIRQLSRAGWAEETPMRKGFWRLAPDIDNAVMLELLARPDFDALVQALAQHENVDGPKGLHRHFASVNAAAALLRLEFFAGKPLDEVADRWGDACAWAGWDQAVGMALSGVTNAALARRLHPSVQVHVVSHGLRQFLLAWEPATLPLEDLATELLAVLPAPNDLRLRMLLAEYRLCTGRADAAESEPGAEMDILLQPLHEATGEDAVYRSSLARAVEAGVLATQARWAQAEQRYDTALAALRKQTGQRKGVLSDVLMLPYLQCLLAQQTPSSLDKALKLCLAETGQRRPTADSPWGAAALAVQMRRGDTPRDLAQFTPLHWGGGTSSQLDFWRWLMRAWLKEDNTVQPLSKAEREAADALLARLQRAGLHRLYAQCEDALNVLAGRPVRPTFFVPAAQESWRAALAALAAIGGPAQPSTNSDPTALARRICWALELGDDGAILDVTPYEQKRGARGWNRPQPASLWALSQASNLPPHDAQVVRCIQRSARGSARDLRIDAAAAVMALIGHPAVEFSDQPGVVITLEAAPPQLEVAEVGENLRLTVYPPLRGPSSTQWFYNAGETRAAEALASTTVIREGAQRARVVRFTPAQRRAALLLGDGLNVPKEASNLLQPVLQGLGAHFQVHVDSLPGGRDVPAQSALRAELTPLGAGLRLRLVVAPLGPEGPRTVPGHGRARMIAAVGGQPFAAQRDLAAERRHLASVREACPLLGGTEIGPAEFEILDAEDALDVLEALPQLEAVQALDWPAGRPVTVSSVGLAQLRVRVHGDRDWFALDGSVQVDEAQVLSLEQLLQWSSGSRGRFVPLGEGRYLALTQELRARIADLAAVVELQRGQASVPAVAALWLDAALDGADRLSDDALRQRIGRLTEAQELAPALPSALQAELRPYQLDGYQWAMRLAAAGWGACLADDMGLGKTLQALAELLARSGGGPALVVAPTSLMGNWLSEARRYAPSLKLCAYGDGVNRDNLLVEAAAHDVVLVSYGLLLLNVDAFAACEWHTVVLDEAQALKNSTARRTQAVHGLKTNFRLALSGTPIENRLTELWSIMRICNPGLLGSLARFNERFAGPIERDGDRDAQRTLKRLVGPFILRRTRSQVLDDLPPRTELTLTIHPDETERAHYEALRRQALAAAEQSMSASGGHAQINVLAQLTRLRRAACDPRLVTPELGLAGAKVQAFGELALELAANAHKALVFSQFVDFLTLLREPLDAAGIGYQYLDGATPTAERTRRVSAFQAGGGALFLISLKAGGFGLNLTVADYVVIADPWWNPAAEDQASGRAHRIGQLRPVTVYRLVSAGTLEERIVELHQHKRALADGVLEGTESHSALDATALMELMRG